MNTGRALPGRAGRRRTDERQLEGGPRILDNSGPGHRAQRTEARQGVPEGRTTAGMIRRSH